jgi:hypothetical protein
VDKATQDSHASVREEEGLDPFRTDRKHDELGRLEQAASKARGTMWFKNELTNEEQEKKEHGFVGFTQGSRSGRPSDVDLIIDYEGKLRNHVAFVTTFKVIFSGSGWNPDCCKPIE